MGWWKAETAALQSDAFLTDPTASEGACGLRSPRAGAGYRTGMSVARKGAVIKGKYAENAIPGAPRPWLACRRKRTCGAVPLTGDERAGRGKRRGPGSNAGAFFRPGMPMSHQSCDEDRANARPEPAGGCPQRPKAGGPFSFGEASAFQIRSPYRRRSFQSYVGTNFRSNRLAPYCPNRIHLRRTSVFDGAESCHNSLRVSRLAGEVPCPLGRPWGLL